MQLRFVRSESAFTYFEALELYLERHGAPVAFYAAREGVIATCCGVNGRSDCLKAKAEGVCLTRPDLILQAGSAAQIGADRRAVPKRKMTFQLCTNGHSNFPATCLQA
jgi:hypothetical protein